MPMPFLSALLVRDAGPYMSSLVIFFLVGVLALCLPACSGSGANGGSGEENGVEAPVAPTGLGATSRDGAVELEWDASNGADTYRIYRSLSSGVDASGSSLETGIDAPGHVDTSAENGTKYYYVVTAVASEGGESAESDPSSEVDATPFSEPPDRP